MRYLEEFNKWYAHMIGSEGGYVDDKFDKGGKTNQGVTIATYLHFAQRLGLPKTLAGLKALSAENHRKIALFYWNATKPNFFNSGRIIAFFAEEFWAAGSGVTKFYQRKLNLSFDANLVLDGGIGKKTIGAMNAIDEYQMWKMLCTWKRERYFKISERDKTQLRFKKGWANRYLRFEKLFEQKEVIKIAVEKPIKVKTKIDIALENIESVLIETFEA